MIKAVEQFAIKSGSCHHVICWNEMLASPLGAVGLNERSRFSEVLPDIRLMIAKRENCRPTTDLLSHWNNAFLLNFCVPLLAFIYRF